MKKVITVFCLCAALLSTVIAADITFTWTPNPVAELVSGYQIEYTKVPGVTNWTTLTTVSGTTNVAIVTGIQPGYQYNFRAWAINAVGKSTNQSNIIPVPNSAPSGVSNFITK